MFNAEQFYEIVKTTGGFEMQTSFRNDVDHYIGGIGNKIWYYTVKGKTEDYYVCTIDDDKSEDVHYTIKKNILASKPAKAGKTMELILSELTIGQEEIENSGRKPIQVEACEHPVSHYQFMFGERAYKVSDEYGMTVEYSNINDEESGFRFRGFNLGEDVSAPKEK